MKKMLVIGMTFVVLLVSAVTVYANLANDIPEDQMLLDWYIRFEYDPDYHAVLLEDSSSCDSMEAEYGCDYITYYAVDDDENVHGYGTVCKSYVESLYLRNN